MRSQNSWLKNSALLVAFSAVSRVWLCSLVVLSSFAAESGPTGSDPEKQKESDWVDARWSQTDLGNFHASVLSLPGGAVAKGLSIRVGANREATVAYDTGSASFRAGWTNGFLTFSGTRYGLMHAPKPAGDIRLVLSDKAWGVASVKWRGLHVHGPHVVLDYTVGYTRVKELPGYHAVDGLAVFTRTLEFGPSKQSTLLTLIRGEGREFNLKSVDDVNLASLTADDQSVVLATTGDMGADLRWSDGALHLQLPPGENIRTVKIFISSMPTKDSSRLAAVVKQFSTPEDVTMLAEPGPSRWQPLTTRGQVGIGNDAYVVDTLTVPYDNPWKALFFTSGVDFLPNGNAAVCTIHGDVWLVSGVDSKLEKLTWRRFATGLHQPLGLRVRQGRVYVLGRDQITRLQDANGDGEADFYENFFNGINTSTGGHDYVTSLEKDTNGNFYYVDPRGVHRVAANGSKQETIASGWRNPNGMGASPDGQVITVAPQEGEWTPSSAIAEARSGGWYGYGGPKKTPERPLGYDTPLCWIPHSVDNSGGSQLWVTSERWGPLNGQMLHFSFGRCAQFLVLREIVDGISQGALVPLPGKFLSGAMRGAFNPRDGQLYVVGSRGWQTSAARDGCLQRVRYTGKDPVVPVEYHAHSNGLRLTFTTHLDHTAAGDAGSYAVTQWNYRYAAKYGSKDYSVINPDKEGRDTLEVRSAKLLSDGRTVFLEIPGLQPVMQWELKYSLNTTEGKTVRSQLHGTINKLGPEWKP
jgi:hypothetical protein